MSTHLIKAALRADFGPNRGNYFFLCSLVRFNRVKHVCQFNSYVASASSRNRRVIRQRSQRLRIINAARLHTVTFKQPCFDVPQERLYSASVASVFSVAGPKEVLSVFGACEVKRSTNTGSLNSSISLVGKVNTLNRCL